MSKSILSLSIIAILAMVSVSMSFDAPVTGTDVSDEYAAFPGGGSDQQDWSTCIEKVGSEWGGNCLNYGFSEEKYTVHLVNTCGDDVDLMCCVQRTNDRWSCFYRMDMGQNDTLHAYACQGKGKFLKWVRKAGDVTTKFPSRDDVNREY